jgi:hypothetical protein
MMLSKAAHMESFFHGPCPLSSVQITKNDQKDTVQGAGLLPSQSQNYTQKPTQLGLMGKITLIL